MSTFFAAFFHEMWKGQAVPPNHHIKPAAMSTPSIARLVIRKSTDKL